MSSNPEEQTAGSQLLDIMKKNYEEDQDDEVPNKFSSNFHPLNPESFNNNINSDNNKNKSKQDTDPNYDDFLNAGGDKLISGLNKLNLGNNSLNSNISPKKPEQSNFFQNPMMNMNMNNKNNQKDLAFNYYFGMQGEQGKKGVESGNQNVSSQILEHLRFNQNIDHDINEQQFKNYFNNQANDNNKKNDDEKIENNMYKLNTNNNNLNLNQQQKMILNMNFQNKNQKIGLNEDIINQNQNQNNNKMPNMNNLNLNNQMMQMQMNNNLNNMNLGQNIQLNKMDPRIRNIIQQNMIQQNLMMGNNNINNMQMNPNQNQIFLNNQNNMPMNQKNQNNNKCLIIKIIINSFLIKICKIIIQ